MPGDQLELLKRWQSTDQDMARIIRATLRDAEADTLEQLQKYWPITFAELFEAISGIMDDPGAEIPDTGWRGL